MPRELKPQRQFPIVWSSIELTGRERVLVLDQSLANTGWAYMTFRPDALPIVESIGTIVTKPITSLSGMEDSFVRGEELLNEISIVISALLSEGIDLIIHETPSMMGMGSKTKSEQGPIAVMAVRAAVRTHQSFAVRKLPIEMLQAQVVQAWVAGKRGATKERVHAEMWKIIPEFRTNEHVRDAVALAITYIARRDLDRRIERWRETKTLTRKP